MSLLFDKISDATDGDLAIPVKPAYWGPLYMSSPSGNYVGAFSSESNTSTASVAKTDVAPPEFIWKGDLYLGAVSGVEIATYATPLAVDDEGSMWCDASNLDGKLLEIPVGAPVPEIAFTWTDDAGLQHGLQATQLYTFTASDSTIRIVMVPGGTIGHDNPLAFLGVKGTPGLTKFDTGGTWVVWFAFMDDNDDIWLAGAPPGGATTTMNLWRITDLASSTYDDLITVTMPDISRKPVGYFAGGSFVGAWGDDTANHYFKVNLTTGVLTTRDISSAPVNLQGESGSHAATPPDPDHFFFWLASDADERTMIELLPDMTDGETYSLDMWGADDGVQAGDDGSEGSMVKSPVYLDALPAFAGVRQYTIDDTDDLNSDLFLYYFGDEGGTVDEDIRLRVWPYSLDGHDYAVFRLGPSESLVYDLATGQWAEWRSPDRSNWRAHIGQNWIGMSADTFARGFGSDVVCGDDTEGVLWILDPTAGQDDDPTTGDPVPFTRTVTGGVSLASRETVPCGAVQVGLSLGNPALTGATISLRTSDNAGHSWTSHGSITVAADDHTAVIEWRALGQMKQPGRVFEISDNGAAVRISGADMR